MLLLKPGETVPVARGDRVYHVAVPTVADRARFHREVRVAGGRQHWPHEMLDLARRGIIACLDESDPMRETYLGMVAESRAGMQAALEAYQDTSLDEDERNLQMVEAFRYGPALLDLFAMIERAYLPYREAVADNLVYDETRAAVAARLFLAGIEGGPAPFRRGFNGVDEAVLATIPAADLAAILGAVLGMIEARPDEKKDSARSTTGEPTPRASTATRTPAPKRRSTRARAGTSSH